MFIPRDPITHVKKIAIPKLTSTYYIEKNTRYTQSMDSNTKSISRKEEYTKGIALLQKIKKQQRLNAPIIFNQQNTFYNENSNYFHYKRFKMNPRFTWLYKVEEGSRHWMNNINEAFTKSPDTPSTQIKFHTYEHPKHKRSYKNGSMNVDEELYGKKQVQSLNFSEMILDSPYRNSAYNHKGSEWGDVKERRFNWSKNNGIGCTRLNGEKDKQAFILNDSNNINFTLSEEYPRKEDRVKNHSVIMRRNNNKVRKRINSIIIKTSKAKECPLNKPELSNKNKNYCYEKLIQGELVKQRHLYNKGYRIYIEKDPIFNLSAAIKSHKNKFF